jgi:hypothetical protein
MLFSVIYSFECPPNESVNRYYPTDWQKLWDLTECHFSEFDESEGLPVTERYKHRKVCALLTKDQFLDFIWDCDLVAEDIETMGSLGAPGFGIGWAPAISFHNDNLYQGGWADAYVTPIPFTKLDDDGNIVEVLDAFPMSEDQWYRIRDFMVDKFS